MKFLSYLRLVLVPAVDPALAALLADARVLPRQPDIVRTRAMARARLAAANGGSDPQAAAAGAEDTAAVAGTLPRAPQVPAS